MLIIWPQGGQALRARVYLLLQPGAKDSLPEWSKGVDSSSTSASCVGSNPTAVIYQQVDPGAHATMRSQFAK